MPKTLDTIHREIARLQAEAEAIKAKEKAGVVARIHEAIEHYGITTAELFPKARKTKRAAGKLYRSPEGQTWGGRGKRPQWLHDALAAGKTLDELRVQ